MLIQQANDYIQATTYTYDPSLGKQGASGKPAKAILAEQQQSEQGNSNYLDNLARAMRHEARVVLGMTPAIYDRPGRLVRAVDAEDNELSVLINQPFVEGPDGQPMPAPEQGMLGKLGGALGLKKQQQPKTYDLRKGIYGVSVSIGKSHRSRLEAGSDALGQIIQAAPEMMPILGPTWLKFQDFPGHNEAAELLKKMQPPQLQQGKDGEEESPEALQQKVQQMGQMLEQAKQEMDGMRQALETKQVEQQGKMQAAQASEAGKAQIEQMRQAFEAQKIQMEAQIDAQRIETEGQVKAMLARLQGVIDLKLQDDQQAHDVAMAAAGAGQADQQADKQHEQGMESGEASHAQGLEMQDKAARAQGDGAGE